MANLKDLIVNGVARIVGKVYSSGGFVGHLEGSISIPRVVKDSKTFQGTNKVVFEEYVPGSNHNLPGNAWYHIISMQGDDASYGTQLALGMTTEGAYYRVYNNRTWGDWKSLINTDTTYSSLAASSGGTAVSLVTTGEKATWNGKANTSGTYSGLSVGSAAKATSVADYGDTSKSISIGYAGAGVAAADASHMAVYTSSGTKIKDMSFDNLKTKLGLGTLAYSNATIPTNTNQLTNGAGFITGINSSMVTNALGYTPMRNVDDLEVALGWNVASVTARSGSDIHINYLKPATKADSTNGTISYSTGGGLTFTRSGLCLFTIEMRRGLPTKDDVLNYQVTRYVTSTGISGELSVQLFHKTYKVCPDELSVYTFIVPVATGNTYLLRCTAQNGVTGTVTFNNSDQFRCFFRFLT